METMATLEHINAGGEFHPPQTPRRLNKLKLFLNVILILFAFFACYVEDIYLFYRPPQVGQIAPLTFRAQSNFSFDQQKIFGSLRNAAMAQHIPIYAFNRDRVAATKAKMEAFIDEVLKEQSRGREGREALVSYLRKEFEVNISLEDAARLLRYPNLKNLLSGIETTQASMSDDKIVENPGPLTGKKIVRILYPDPEGVITFPADEITTLEQARLNLRNRLQQIFWQVEPRILDPLLQVTVATLQPNLTYDKKANDQRIETIIHQFPSEVMPYRPGDVLVPFLTVMDHRDVLLLTSSQETENRALYGQAPLSFFIIIFSVVLYNLMLTRIFSPCGFKEPPYQLFISALILTIFFCKANLLFTPLPVYIVPFAVLPLLLVLLQRERISVAFATVLGAILISLFAGYNLGILLFLAFGGVVAILTSFGIRKRSQILIPALIVGITNTVMALLLFAVSHGQEATWWSRSGPLLDYMGWALVGGLVAGPLAILLLPLLELSWRNASVFKLNKFTDLQHPLMEELLTTAPGTYQHSMSLAYLAYALGEAIGANSLLLRVGAYYHDIGKTVQPDFYVENLFGRKSPHDDIPPRESARIIMEHVINGQKIAREAGLPEMVVDFIPQHHGTRLIEYFYDKAVKANPGGEVSQEDFRYKGPKPQSVEAAILMIVDALEATSRTMEDPTPEKIEAMIRHFIVGRLNDGQFDECNLTTREIAKITTALIHALEAAHHKRVAYPWQEEEKKEGRKEKTNEDQDKILNL
jgi:putative nucleotidyltransferase with HDIG domain